MSPGELLWDLATILTIGALARGLTRARADAARWQRLAELNLRAHLIRPGGPDELKYGPVIPAELLDKLPTFRPGDMARHRYAAGGYVPDPWLVAKAAADLDKRIAAEEARRSQHTTNPTDKETDHE